MKRVDISREKLVSLYNEKRLTMPEIAKIYNVNRSTISNRLKEFGIKSNPNQRKYETIKSIPLSKQQKEMIVGSSLGDASIVLSGRRINPYFKVSHCEKQKDYLLWKKEILGNLVNKVNRLVDKRGNSTMYDIHTLSHVGLIEFRNLFYNNNIKVIKEEIEKHLTPFGLAVWFMDDGGKSGRGNNYRLSTDSFSWEDNFKLKNILERNFNLNAKVFGYQKHNDDFYYLFFDKHNAIKMTKIIKPYIVDCMKYKLMKLILND